MVMNWCWSTSVKYFKGLAIIWPLFTLTFLLFTFANSAVPATSGFIAEFLSFVGLLNDHPEIAVISSLAVLLTPAYALLLFHRTAYGQISSHLSSLFGNNNNAGDLTPKEFHIILTLLNIVLLLGLFPNLLFNLIYYSTIKSLSSLTSDIIHQLVLYFSLTLLVAIVLFTLFFIRPFSG